MMQPTPKQLEAMKLLGISLEEWQFTTGRYLEARDELHKLRMSLARIAEHLGVARFIPGYVDGVHLFDAVKHIERGWSRLAAEIIDNVRSPPKCEECGKNYADPPSKLCPGCQAYQEHLR